MKKLLLLPFFALAFQIGAFGQMAINTVVGGIDFATDKPLPARGIACIQGGVPVLIPVQ